MKQEKYYTKLKPKVENKLPDITNPAGAGFVSKAI